MTHNCTNEKVECITTDLCPDAVELCPNSKLLLCATYEVLDSSPTSVAYDISRCGSLATYCLTDDYTLLLQNKLNTEAIFDIKWAPNAENLESMFIAGDAKGKVSLYSIKNEKINFINELKLFEKSLSVSINWSTNENAFLATGSNGEIAVVNLDTDTTLISRQRWSAHEFEAWTAAFDHTNNSIVYSGGDDSLFLGWDLRNTKTPTFRNRSHDAGVCFVTCNPKVDHEIVTGSYDEYLRIWDNRNLKKQPVRDIKLGGGVWKIKWHSTLSDTMLVPCMYNGLKIIHNSNKGLNIIAEIGDSGPLTYGADWQKNKDHNIVASCTFYEKKIYINKVTLT